MSLYDCLQPTLSHVGHSDQTLIQKGDGLQMTMEVTMTTIVVMSIVVIMPVMVSMITMTSPLMQMLMLQAA